MMIPKPDPPRLQTKMKDTASDSSEELFGPDWDPYNYPPEREDPAPPARNSNLPLREDPAPPAARNSNPRPFESPSPLALDSNPPPRESPSPLTLDYFYLPRESPSPLALENYPPPPEPPGRPHWELFPPPRVPPCPPGPGVSLLTQALQAEAAREAAARANNPPQAREPQTRNGLGPPFEKGVEGSADGMKCSMCKVNWAECRCPLCGEDFFCTIQCMHDSKMLPVGGHECRGPYPTSSDALIESINQMDDFDEWTHNQFFCHRGYREMEKYRPVYDYLINRLGVTVYQLEYWRRVNTVYRNMIRMLNRNLDGLTDIVYKRARTI